MYCNVCHCHVSAGNWEQHCRGRQHRSNESQLKTETSSQSDYSYTCDDTPTTSSVQDMTGNQQYGTPHRICPTCSLLNATNVRKCSECGWPLDDQRVVFLNMPSQSSTQKQPVNPNQKKKGPAPVPTQSSSNAVHQHTVWNCVGCTFANPSHCEECSICGTPNPNVPQSARAPPVARAQAITVDDDSESDISSYEGEGDEEFCVVCLHGDAVYYFGPCGHTMLCCDCITRFKIGDPCPICKTAARHMGLNRRAQKSKKERRARREAKQAQRSAVPQATAARSQRSHVEPPRTVGQWRAAPSTFPWMGGSIEKWKSFLNEVSLGAAERITDELIRSGLYPQNEITIERCKWAEAVDRFKEGWQQLACPEGVWSGLFAWHAAKSFDATVGIAKHGWDHSRRQRNNHGSGEYFASHHSQVIEYNDQQSGNFRVTTLLLGFILRGEHLSWVEDHCFVCNNPEDDRQSYCLPVSIVRFKQGAFRWNVPRFPYRWQFQWQNDEGEDFINYENDVNQKLNRLQCLLYGKCISPPEAVLRIQVQHEDDDEFFEYEIDLKNFVQTNTETNFTRPINLKCVPAVPLPKTLWLSLSPNEIWIPLDMWAQRELTAGYFKYYGPLGRADDNASSRTAQKTQRGSSNRRVGRQAAVQWVKDTQLRTMEVQVNSRPHCIDLEELIMYPRNNDGALLTGRPLAVVDA